MTRSQERGGRVPLLTVVVLCGPDTGAVAQTLQSLRAQTIQDFDILLAGVGITPDNLPHLAGQPALEPFQVIGAEAGIASACNAAAARSPARYICFLQPGEEIEETYLEKCLFHLEVVALDLCGSWQMRTDGLLRSGPFTLSALLADDVSMSAVIRREALLRAAGFDLTIEPQFLVWDLWIRMAARGARGHLISEPLVRGSGSRAAKSAGAAFLSSKHGNLLTDAAAVQRIDAGRTGAPLLNSYAALLDDARPPQSPGVVIAMPFLDLGGGERSMAGLSRELTRRGFRVFLVTTEPPSRGCTDTSDWFRDSVAALYHLPRFLAAELRLAFFSYLIQRHALQVLLQVGSRSVYRWLPRWKELFADLSVVDLLFNPVGHADSYSRNRELIDHIVVEHEGMAAWLEKQGEPRIRISVIPNGVDLNRFTPQPPRDWRTGGPRRNGTFVTGFFGRLSEEKAPDTFLRVAARFRNRPGFQFLICGAGRMESSLRSQCRQYALEDTVHFLGSIETIEYLPCCHLTITCSRLDGRPNIILESLAMCVPVVASRVGGIPEMAPAGNGTWLCEPEDIDGFCEAIERLASDAERYAALAAAGRSWVERQCSLQTAAGLYASLFDGLMKTRPRLVRPAENQTAIAEALRPASRLRQPLPDKFLPACFHILRSALARSNMPGALRTVWLYTKLRSVRSTALEFQEFFDAGYYALHYPDVRAAGIPLQWHYLLAGFREGCNPSPRFDTDYYLESYADVAASGVNPLVHYLRWGLTEGRTCTRPLEYRWLPRAVPRRPQRAINASQASPTVSVVIPTKNAGTGFNETMAALRKQPHPLEIVVVDSGSSDGTLDVAREHGARIVSIPPESFNHGETRNLGIRQTKGQFCIMLVQDAVPLGKSWLEEMLAPFADETVVGVTARQVPRPDSDSMARWQCDHRSRFLGAEARLQEAEVWENFLTLDFQERLRLASFDNSFSILRRSFWEQSPFRGLSFAEDLDWGVRAIAAGRRLVYQPSVCVLHSHTRPAVYHLRRSYISGRAVPKILHLPPEQPAARNDQEFLGLIGFLCGEARALLSESGDWTQFFRCYDAVPGPVESLLAAAGRPANWPGYRHNAARESFYSILDQLLGSDFASVPRKEAGAIVVKALAESVGAYAAMYHNWCEARHCDSDGMRRLAAALSIGV